MDNEQSNQGTPAPAAPVAAAPAPAEAKPAAEGVDNDLLMGILCYLGPLVLIPFLTAKENPFVKFHMKQGIVLVGIWFITYIVQETVLPWRYWEIVGFINLGIAILSIIGIVFVVQKKQMAIPIIGNLAENIKI